MRLRFSEMGGSVLLYINHGRPMTGTGLVDCETAWLVVAGLFKIELAPHDHQTEWRRGKAQVTGNFRIVSRGML